MKNNSEAQKDVECWSNKIMYEPRNEKKKNRKKSVLTKFVSHD
jgi:hypothetical protein